jgi:hypothetical protein
MPPITNNTSKNREMRRQDDKDYKRLLRTARKIYMREQNKKQCKLKRKQERANKRKGRK